MASKSNLQTKIPKTKRGAVLVHGWDPKYYNNNLAEKVDSSIAWSSRKKLIKLLQTNYDIKFYNLPGFCNTKIPTKKSVYDVEDFTNSLDAWLKDKKIKPDVFIGYSFGGAVLLDYLANYNTDASFVLISPAIIRAETSRSKLAHLLKSLLPEILVKLLKHPYQYFASKYYRKGDSFLRKSYDLIVRRDLRDLLRSIDKKRLLLIYGNSDSETPYQLVQKDVKKHDINHFVIEGGKHSIGQTHPNQISQAIYKFLSNRS